MKCSNFITILLALHITSNGAKSKMNRFDLEKMKLGSADYCPGGYNCILDTDANSWCIVSTPPML